MLDFAVIAKYPNAMLNPKLLDEMSTRVSTLLASTPAGEVEKNMRARALGGSLQIVPRDGGGVSVRLDVPLALYGTEPPMGSGGVLS